MDEVLKNSSLFVDILRMSKTRMIQQWDTEAFQRAVNWARYFEQVYEKLKNREPLKQKLTSHLYQLSLADSSISGNLVTNFEDLQNAKNILKNNILQNAFCTAEIYAELLRCFYKSNDSNNVSETEAALKEDLNKILELGFITRTSKNIGMKILKYEQENIKTDLKPKFGHLAYQDEGGGISSDGDTEEIFRIRVKSRLLRKWVSNYLEKNDDNTTLIHKLDTVTSLPKGEMILLQAYVRNINDGQVAISNTNTRNEFEDWRRKFHYFIQGYIRDNLFKAWKSDLKRLFLLPASKLVEVAKACDQFAKLYAEMLRFCCNEYDKEFGIKELYISPCSGGDVERSQFGENWKKTLKEHYKALCCNDMVDIANYIGRQSSTDDKEKLTESIWNEIMEQNNQCEL